MFLRDVYGIHWCFTLIIYRDQLTTVQYDNIRQWQKYSVNNCYEELNRNFKEVLYNTLTLLQANQLELNIETTKTVRSITEFFA